MQTGSILTGTDPIRWTRTWWSVQSSQLNSMPNAIQQWEGARVPRLPNMEEFRHPQPQRVPCFQSAELGYPNCGTRNDSALYIRCCLCVKWLIRLPQGPHKLRVRQIFRKNDRYNQR